MTSVLDMFRLLRTLWGKVQSVSMTAEEQWVEANTKASSWNTILFRWMLLAATPHILPFKSQGHLESTSVAEDMYSCVFAAYWCKETPRGLKYVLESRPESSVFMMVHMPRPQGTGEADVSHSPLGSPNPSFSPSFLPKYWHYWRDRGSTAALSWGFVDYGPSTVSFFFIVSWSSCSDHPFFQLLAGKGAIRAGAVRTD